MSQAGVFLMVRLDPAGKRYQFTQVKSHLTIALLTLCVSASAKQNVLENFVSENDVTWATLGTNENDSMPIGNGDIVANVWTEQTGDLVLLVAKADAWTELGKLVKLGRVRMRLSPNPFGGSAAFEQKLSLETGTIEIKSGANTVQVWIDANHPVMHVETHLARPGTIEVDLELWRTRTCPFETPSPERGGLFEFGGHPVPINFEPDTVLPAQPARITWCHFNSNSIYPLVLRQEHLEELLAKCPDPLLHRCFGAALSGPGLVSKDDHTLLASAPGSDFRLDLYALTQEQAASPQNWETDLDSLVREVERVKLKQARRTHEQWWSDFWNRSWINVSGTPDAVKVSQSYCIQRWMMACSSRGAQPVKFNGGLFTVGHDLPDGKDSKSRDHNPDFREWGNCYWNQNNRLLYWPLIATGDEDLLKPWFDMYLKALPLARERTRLYYHHDGAAFIETMYFWGLPNLNDFGWDNPSNALNSPWMRYHTQGALEVAMQMLDSYDYSQDVSFAQSCLVPFADAIATYYDQHWSRDANGKLMLSPVQSLETYQRDAVNPTPDVAGLKAILPRLLALPGKMASSDQRKRWAKLLQDVPAIPMGKTSHGRIPPEAREDADGTAIILPAEKYGKPSNSENPELYVAFPYRLYGAGKADLELARRTYAARLFPQNICWGQDGTQASILGLTAESQQAVTSEFTAYGPQRFIWFWRPGHDWIPDLDNGGSGMITLQQMLMQCDGRRIQLLPAWPREWTADFRLHAPYQTTVQGHVERGRVTNLKVTPKSRTKDVVLVPAFATMRQ
jgi:hypothetical protein